jgi:hypothetical protein
MFSLGTTQKHLLPNDECIFEGSSGRRMNGKQGNNPDF